MGEQGPIPIPADVDQPGEVRDGGGEAKLVARFIEPLRVKPGSSTRPRHRPAVGLLLLWEIGTYRAGGLTPHCDRPRRGG